MAAHSSALAWRIYGVTQSRTRLSDLAAAADLFKKIRDTKGTFHAKMGTIHDRNGRTQQKQKILKKVASIHRRASQPR